MSSKTVFIVEDECIIATDIQMSLEGMGYQVCGIASSGEDAIKRVPSLHPDVILMDINLKGEMDGITAADLIYQSNNVPVIYLTANSNEQLISRAKRSHAYGYLLKPFDEREMKSMIELTLEKHELESRIHRNHDWLTTILQSISDAVVVGTNTGNIQMMNPAAERLTGWSESEALGKNIHELLSLSSDRKDESTIDFVQEVVRQGRSLHSGTDSFIVNKSGKRFPISYHVAPLLQDNIIAGIVLTFQDRTHERSIEQKLRNLALTDELTGLYNRYGFFTLGRNLFEQAESEQKSIAIAYADLDKMKWINDYLGHPMGDMAVQMVAQAIRETFREKDLFARIGGDEFAGIIVGMEPFSAEKLQNRLTSRLQKIIQEKESQLPVSISIGFAVYNPEKRSTFEDLLKRADLAMYRDKESKRQHQGSFDSLFNDVLMCQKQLESA